MRFLRALWEWLMLRFRFKPTAPAAPPQAISAITFTPSAPEIVESNPAGTPVFVVGNDLGVSADYTLDNSDFTFASDGSAQSSATGVTAQVYISSAAALTGGVNETVNITADDGIVGSPLEDSVVVGVVEEGDDLLLAEITRTNWDGSNASSSAFFVGQVFQDGDIPTGSFPVLTSSLDVDETYNAVNHVYYNSGALAFCHFVVDHSNVAASGTKVLKVKSREGTYTAAPRSYSFSDLLNDVDPLVEFSSVTHSDNSATNTHGSGAMLGKMSDLDPDYVESKVDDSCVKTFLGEAYVKDGADGSGSADPHLKIIWEATVYFNSDGSVKAIDVTPTMVQAEVAVATKYRLNYTATFKDGASTIATYSSRQHYYRGMWSACNTADSNASGRPHRLVGTANTLTSTYDKAYWFGAECFFNGSYDPTYTPNEATGDGEGSDTIFDPLSRQGQRGFIDQGGGYAGRGPMSEQNIHAIMRQGARDWRIMRVNAHAAVHLPYHYHPPIGAYPPSPLTLRLDNDLGAGSATAWTGDGMPTAIYCSANGASPDAGYSGGYVVHTGGNGPWTPSNDNSHDVNPSILTWIVEGGYHFLRATQDIMLASSIRIAVNVYGSHCRLLTKEQAFGYTIPNTKWSHISCGGTPQERAYGWPLLRLFEIFFTPANRREKNFMLDLAEHHGNYLEQSMAIIPDSHVHLEYNTNMMSPWMQTPIGIGASACAVVYPQFQGFTDFADWQGLRIGGFCSRDIARTIAYRGMWRRKARAYNASTNPWVDHADFMQMFVSTAVGGSTDTITLSGLPALANGDRFYPSATNESAGTVSIMPGTTEGQGYYAVNVVDNGSLSWTCQLSEAEGGAPIDLTTGSYWWLIDFHADSIPSTNQSGSEYALGHLFDLKMQNRRGHAEATDTRVANMKTLIASYTGQPGLGQWRVA